MLRPAPNGDDAAEVALLRHPPADVPAGTCYGRTDVPLLPGWERAIPDLAATAWQAAVRLVVSSPLSRCLLPASALASRLCLPLQVDDDLVELDFGDWERLSWNQVPRDGLDRWAADPLCFAPPGGEAGAALIKRVNRFAARLRDAGIGTLVVSHGGPLRLLAPILRGEPPDLLKPAPAMGRIERMPLFP